MNKRFVKGKRCILIGIAMLTVSLVIGLSIHADKHFYVAGILASSGMVAAGVSYIFGEKK